MAKRDADFGRAVLLETPGRALTFLCALARGRDLAALLAKAGYGASDHDEGWTLLRAVAPSPAPPAPDDDAKGRDAFAEVDRWDNAVLPRCKAALDRLHPEQSRYVFANLKAQDGTASLGATLTFLARLDALEGDPARAATRDADHAALRTLEKRGVTPEERRRVAALVGYCPDLPSSGPPADTERNAELVALKRWYDDWAATARSVVHRRDQQIRLGIAQMHRKAPQG